MKLKIHYGYFIEHNRCRSDYRPHRHIYGCHYVWGTMTKDLSKVTCKVGMKYQKLDYRGMLLRDAPIPYEKSFDQRQWERIDFHDLWEQAAETYRDPDLFIKGIGTEPLRLNRFSWVRRRSKA